MLKAFLRLQSFHWSHAATPNDGVVEADLHLHFYKIRVCTLATHFSPGHSANTLLSLQPALVASKAGLKPRDCDLRGGKAEI